MYWYIYIIIKIKIHACMYIHFLYVPLGSWLVNGLYVSQREFISIKVYLRASKLFIIINKKEISSIRVFWNMDCFKKVFLTEANA